MGMIAVWLPRPGTLASLEGGAALGKGDSISPITPRRGSLCPKPRAITSIAGAIPVQWSVSVAFREDQTSGLAGAWSGR